MMRFQRNFHLKCSIFKQLGEAEVSVVLERIEAATVRDASHVHVRALRVKTIWGNKESGMNIQGGSTKGK